MSAGASEPRDVAGRLANLPGAVRAAVVTALGEIAADTVAEARRALSRVGPSRPGNPPADPGGGLTASLEARLDPDADAATVTAADPHARFLEYGTRAMAARPFLRPAAQAVLDDARARLRAAMADAVAQTLGDGP